MTSISICPAIATALGSGENACQDPSSCSRCCINHCRKLTCIPPGLQAFQVDYLHRSQGPERLDSRTAGGWSQEVIPWRKLVVLLTSKPRVITSPRDQQDLNQSWRCSHRICWKMRPTGPGWWQSQNISGLTVAPALIIMEFWVWPLRGQPETPGLQWVRELRALLWQCIH